MAGSNRRSFVAGSLGAFAGVAGCLQLEEADQTDDGEQADQEDDDREEAAQAGEDDHDAADRQLRVEVVGEQFAWTFDPEGNRGPQTGEVVLPAETEIRFEATSRDVVHVLAIASLGVSVDASPDGYETYLDNEGVAPPDSFTSDGA